MGTCIGEQIVSGSSVQHQFAQKERVVIRDCQGHFAPARLAEYEKRIRQSFGRSRHRTLSNWLPAGWLHALGTRLLATPWFLRRVVMDRWFLHRNAW
jgi:hypothetical protein